MTSSEFENSPLQGIFSRRDDAELVQVASDDVAAFVIYEIEACERESPQPDVERFTYRGTTMARTAHEAVGPIIARWLAQAPSPPRVHISAALFIGLWQPHLRSTPISATELTLFKQARDAVPLDVGAERECRQALAVAAESYRSS